VLNRHYFSFLTVIDGAICVRRACQSCIASQYTID